MKKVLFALLAVFTLSASALEVMSTPAKEQPKVEVAPVVKPEVKAEVTAPSKSKDQKKTSEKVPAPVSSAPAQAK